MLVLPQEIVHQIVLILPQQDLIGLTQVSRTCYNLTIPHLYQTIIVTDAAAAERSDSNSHKHYGTVLVYKTEAKRKTKQAQKSKNVRLLCNTFEKNPQLARLVETFITDIVKVTPDLVELVDIVTAHSSRIQRLEYPLSWFKDVHHDINSKVKNKERLQNILTQSFDDVQDLSEFASLKTLKVLESPVSHSITRDIRPLEVDIIRSLRSLAIEDISFARFLSDTCAKSGGEKLANIISFTYKIDCLSTPQKGKFNFEVLEGFLNFGTIKNFKLIVWYTEDTEQYALEFLAKLSPRLINVENFELKRNMMAYTFESPTFNDTFTLTSVNYQLFVNESLSNLKILQISGNYLNKNFIIKSDSSRVDHNSTQTALFKTNFNQIFKYCQNLKVLIIDEFINIKNSSKLMKFLYSSNNEQSKQLKAKLSIIASFGYSQFFIDAFDDDFDENVDCTEYDLVQYCLKKLRQNYIKFSSLDDPSCHFFDNLMSDYGSGNFVDRINYIKSLKGNVDFHKRFFHKDKSWKMPDKCNCQPEDYKIVIDLLVLAMSDHIQILAENLKNLELVILNGLFFKITHTRGKPAHELLFK